MEDWRKKHLTECIKVSLKHQYQWMNKEYGKAWERGHATALEWVADILQLDIQSDEEVAI